MSEKNGTLYAMDMLSKVLIRCFFMGLIILLFWGLLILLGGETVCRYHTSIFKMSPDQFYAINYWGIALTKVLVFLFFFLPYVSIRLVLKNAG